jgi:hypothetical protein
VGDGTPLGKGEGKGGGLALQKTLTDRVLTEPVSSCWR